MADAEIVQLPLKRRLCSDCEHGALSNQGVFCMEFNELIWDEATVASECELFEPIFATTVAVSRKGKL